MDRQTKKIVVTDANIFLDLMDIGLLDEFFSLDLAIYTTVEVLLELDDSQKEQLETFEKANLLKIESNNTDLTMLVFSRSFSEADKSVMIATYNLNAIALTGERKMKNWCTAHELESHGIIWIFDELLENSIVSHEAAIAKMELLISLNQWLPLDICLKRIKEWQ